MIDNKKKILNVICLLLSVLLVFSSCSSGERRATVNDELTKDKPISNKDIPSEKDIFGETRLRFIATGDNIIHEAVYTDAKSNAAVYASTNSGYSAEYRFVDMYDGVADIIKSADFAYVNHETPVAGKSFGISGYPDFNAPEEIGDDLISLGFNIINIANNHMLDMGEAGLRNSINYWNEKDAVIIGGYKKSDYDNIRMIERGGVKIALLSYTTFINDAHRNKISSSSEYLIPYAKEEDIRRQTKLAKESGADLLIVSMHWGDEGSFTPSSKQKTLAKLLADCGVDVTIGNHSHNLQPIEWVTGSGGNKTLTVYSLGNLLSTMLYSYYMVGGIFSFDIVKDEAGTKIEAPTLIPTMCHYSMNRDSLAIYKLEDYTDALVNAHGAQKNGSFTMSTLYGYVKNTVDEEFLPEFLK